MAKSAPRVGRAYADETPVRRRERGPDGPNEFDVAPDGGFFVQTEEGGFVDHGGYEGEASASFRISGEDRDLKTVAERELFGRFLNFRDFRLEQGRAVEQPPEIIPDDARLEPRRTHDRDQSDLSRRQLLFVASEQGFESSDDSRDPAFPGTSAGEK